MGKKIQMELLQNLQQFESREGKKVTRTKPRPEELERIATVKESLTAQSEDTVRCTNAEEEIDIVDLRRSSTSEQRL